MSYRLRSEFERASEQRFRAGMGAGATKSRSRIVLTATATAITNADTNGIAATLLLLVYP